MASGSRRAAAGSPPRIASPGSSPGQAGAGSPRGWRGRGRPGPEDPSPHSGGDAGSTRRARDRCCLSPRRGEECRNDGGGGADGGGRRGGGAGEVGGEGRGHLGGVVGFARIVYTLSTDVVKWLGVGCGRGVRGEAEVGSIWSGWVARGGLGEAARVGCCWVRLLRQAQDRPLRQAQDRLRQAQGRLLRLAQDGVFADAGMTEGLRKE